MTTPQHPDFQRWSQDKQKIYAEQRRAWREAWIQTRTLKPEEER